MVEWYQQKSHICSSCNCDFEWKSLLCCQQMSDLTPLPFDFLSVLFLEPILGPISANLIVMMIEKIEWSSFSLCDNVFLFLMFWFCRRQKIKLSALMWYKIVAKCSISRVRWWQFSCKNYAAILVLMSLGISNPN